MVVTNPTDAEITVSIESQMYTVGANSSLENVREKHAIYWKEQLHNFLEISEEKPKSTVAIKPAVGTVAEVLEVAKVEKEVKDKK